MYFGEYDMFDICETLNLTMETLRFYIFGENGAGSNEHCWFQLKKKLDPVSVAIYIKDKQIVLNKTAGMALNILNESLKRIQNNMLEDSGMVLSLDDTKKLASIVVDMDKMVRLESGKATDIIDSITHMSIADARRILAEDPFAPVVVEGDFEEVDDIVRPDDSLIESSKELKTIERPWEK
jgi:hypothetical protein